MLFSIASIIALSCLAVQRVNAVRVRLVLGEPMTDLRRVAGER